MMEAARRGRQPPAPDTLFPEAVPAHARSSGFFFAASGSTRATCGHTRVAVRPTLRGPGAAAAGPSGGHEEAPATRPGRLLPSAMPRPGLPPSGTSPFTRGRRSAHTCSGRFQAPLVRGLACGGPTPRGWFPLGAYLSTCHTQNRACLCRCATGLVIRCDKHLLRADVPGRCPKSSIPPYA